MNNSLALLKPHFWNYSVLKRSICLFFIFISLKPLLAQDHLLLSEITLQPAAAEYLEIFNPTDEEKMLEDYYIADNQNYPLVTSIPSPFVDPGDFIVRFPNETYLAPNQVVVVAVNGADFEQHYGQLADFEIVSSSDTIPDMVSINQSNPAITNAGEGIAFFFWNGNDDLLQDVDLMNAGIPTETSEILNKSDLPGYEVDAHTIPYQISAAGPGFSTKRIILEGVHEIHGGGNGILGDDETSENISITWDQVYTAPTPGTTDLMTTGILSQSSNQDLFVLYPNPTKNRVKIILNERLDDYQIRIYNAMGTLQHGFGIIELPQDPSIQVDLSNKANGLYFISVVSEGKSYFNSRVIKY